MSYRARFMPLLTAIIALAATACSGSVARPVASTTTAAKVCAGGTVRSAADVAQYGACSTIQGDLRISAPALSDLSALANLRQVTGTLEIAENSGLDDLSGLENLSQVGALVVRDNAELETLRGLDGLVSAGKLVIERNGLYQTAGVSNLRDVGDLVIRDNARLNSLHGFRSLSHAGSVEIAHNPRLCARGLLPALTKVDRQVTVKSNRGLSKPEVRDLLGRIERGLEQPVREVSEPHREASL